MHVFKHALQPMICLLAGAALLYSTSVLASEVQLSLQEEYKDQKTNYTVSIPDIRLHKIDSITGAELPQIAKYVSKNRKLMLDDAVLADADNVLFQCESDGMDIVVIREEYNSFFGPLKLLSAMSGHPIQVSKIFLIVIKDKVVVDKKEIKRKESAYTWLVLIYK
ncbi:hypothetical protein ACO0LL_25850 [Undibacterium sp. TC4M20W]|uniref:hypothetical protein n=1 Tax=Undibacterium sp. TC4M20W TaxID=3413052 RepID=UPI003BF08C23